MKLIRTPDQTVRRLLDRLHEPRPRHQLRLRVNMQFLEQV